MKKKIIEVKDITKRVTSFATACKELGIKPVLPDVSMLRKKDQKAFLSRYKLEVIIEALNEGWIPNWKDYTERKYYVWFRMSPFVGFSWLYYYDLSGVGARLCFKSEILAQYAGTKFKTLYKDCFIIPS